MNDLIELKAQLTLYPTNGGGRQTGIVSGYRPNHVFEYKKGTKEFETTYIGDINFVEKKILFPGETHHVIVRFLKHQKIQDFIKVGRIWWIHEGNRKIGEAQIIEI